MVKAVVFDAYGTLFDVYSIVSTAESIFPGRGPVLATCWRDKQIEYTRLRTLCNRYADFWQVTSDALVFCCEDLGLPLTEDDRARLMAEYERLQAFPENMPALERMRSAGLPLGILSNGTQKMLETALAASGLGNYLDKILSVDAVRKFKTASEAYDLGPKAFGIPAGDILFVSSNGWDVSGAAWFGYHTFWLNRANRPIERLGIKPHAVGTTMDNVATYAVGNRGRPE
ncbi:haloacid dehalogenase type II [Hyphomicrobium sp.]|uniref:haloacid dehalogenase type II n=1 Tax=Hyphomicrobium sp. TaxID=82 RepID=UPI0025C4EB4A|nr:haloacid dehalogenase type II [Hyphomicrobium sp.]MCC7254111.1 haloacid dehalogenase type II [Hyphomicrobium sp.]